MARVHRAESHMSMRRWSLVPTVALLGALFMVLAPHRSGPAVRMAGLAFRPGTVRIQPGGAVTFENRSSTTHTATCEACALDAGDVQPGLAKTLTFARAGTYQIVCRYHVARGMQMTVVVGSPRPSPAAS
jgi:plastocyanin